MSGRQKILVIEDEDDIMVLISFNLIKDGYMVTCVATGEEALQTAQVMMPDLILLDLMLPGIDGLEVCRLLKGNPRTHDILVVMLTARGEEADIVRGLEAGADDYITKPFSPRVLLARVGAVLRRIRQRPPEESALITFPHLSLHPGRHEVHVDGILIDVTLTEFRILHLLARRPGWAFTRSQIVDSVRGEDHDVTERSVDVHIFSLRKKLGSVEGQIETIRGVGYRFKE